MTVTLPPELERRLTAEAAKQGLDVEQFAVKVLGVSLPADRKTDAVSLLQLWIDADDTEAADQKATGIS